LDVLFRWNKHQKQTQLTLVSKKDLLGLLEEIPSSEATLLLNVRQRHGVVDSPEDGRLMNRWWKDPRQIDPQSSKLPSDQMHFNVSLSLSSIPDIDMSPNVDAVPPPAVEVALEPNAEALV
jgi:hypothetical protein